ncbi:hypothetical protein GCM10010302_71360 [Streptomyces polychromogenes]|uniref:Uncharacterized protein n=1 Tax=Streptomyces polychromogenes TaxID=67342 RepID=A0ABP3FQD6_9ACTN
MTDARTLPFSVIRRTCQGHGETFGRRPHARRALPPPPKGSGTPHPPAGPPTPHREDVK